jgi:3-oxoacyl-[acyl-carrier-protein] synthase III
MKLAGLAYELGSKIVTNEAIYKKVEQHSKQHLQKDDLQDCLSLIEYFFDKSGAITRRWIDDRERPIDLTCRAVEKALKQANLVKSDIDLVIHVGLGRAFLEAGQSYFVAQALGMNRVHCFDIMDACNSWSRGMFVAYNFLISGAYKNILIVNTEFNMLEGGIINPSNFEIKDPDAVSYSFAGLTLGDGASATIVSQDNTNTWEFQFGSRPDVADVCAVPMENYQLFALPSEKLGKNGVNKFTSFAREMHKLGRNVWLETVLKGSEPSSAFDWILPHGYTYNFYENIARRLKVDFKIMKWNTYQHYGNLASASIPTAMAMGIEAGEIEKGQKLRTLVASGGMSFSSISFTY